MMFSSSSCVALSAENFLAEVDYGVETDSDAAQAASVHSFASSMLEASGLCGAYAADKVFTRKDNAGKDASVVWVRKEHLTSPGVYGLPETQADNTMLTTTACAFDKLRADAAKAGHRITINSAFRSYARQVYFWNCYQCKVQGRSGCCNNGNLAARPGTSNHGWGLALDLQLSSAAYQWMRTNAEKHGFVRTVPSESWHWENRPGKKQSDYFKI